MPDGRVWTAGGEYTQQSGFPNYALELYQPSYMRVNNRIEIITPPPKVVSYAKTFEVGYSTPGSDQRFVHVALMRFGSATHGWDSDQRYIGVPLAKGTGNTLTVTAPPDGTVAPPGYYMLWLISAANVPCKQAAILQLGH